MSHYDVTKWHFTRVNVFFRELLFSGPHFPCQSASKGRVNRGNLLSQHAHFALSKEQAEAALDEVAGWEAELHDYYSQFLSGAELDAAVDATSGAHLKR